MYITLLLYNPLLTLLKSAYQVCLDCKYSIRENYYIPLLEFIFLLKNRFILKKDH